MRTNVAAHLRQAITKVLTPLVAIMLRSGVAYHEFCGLAKGVFIDVAANKGVHGGPALTRAQISVLTGIGRKDIDRYIDTESQVEQVPPTLALAVAEILNIWHTDSRFVAPYGVPLELDFSRSEGRSFTDLVAALDPKLNANRVLTEMIEAGVVGRTGDSHYRPLMRTFLFPEFLSATAFEHLGRTMTDLASTLNHNFNVENTRKLIERRVFADDGLTESQQLEFDEYARKRVQELIVDIDNWFVASNSRVDNQSQPKNDVGIAIFEYVRPTRKYSQSESTTAANFPKA